MKLKEVVKNREILSNAGVFMAFLAFSFLSFTLVSPIISSNAETNTASVEAGPYTMSISSSDSVPISITPTTSQALYTANNMISYTNTCPYGFNVTMSAISEDTALSRVGVDDEIKTIPSITEAARTLSDNSWGYSIDHGTSYNPIPALSSPENIINTFSSTTDVATLRLIYGVMVDNNLPSGKYSNDMIYTVSAKPQCLTYGITWNLDDGTAASGAEYPTSLNFGQTVDLTSLTPSRDGYEFTGWSNGTATFDGTETAANINPSSAPSVTMTAQWEQVVTMQTFDLKTMLPNVGDSMTLRDERDDNMYTVKKLADGRVWMIENLRLINKTISSTDSNLPSGETYTVPASDLSSFTTAYNTNSAYLDSTYGGYYNFYTATAGWGTDTAESGSSPKDICPKGWRLPTNSEFEELYNHYNSKDLMMGDPAFVMAGVATDGIIKLRNEHGYYWSSINSDGDASNLDIKNNGVSPDDYSSMYRGYLVRCVVDETMQNYDFSKLVNAGDAATLTDERDGNKYTVKRLADGNVWMVENLRIIDKEISSEDSNLPDGETWTIPASDLASFNETYNKNTAYYDSTYGGYYSFYTVTAGWGTTEISRATSPKDICPKGWRLPTGSEIESLWRDYYYSYYGDLIINGDPAFYSSGAVNKGKYSGQGGNYTYYWSSDSYGSNFGTTSNIVTTGMHSATGMYQKYYGFATRCLVK